MPFWIALSGILHVVSGRIGARSSETQTCPVSSPPDMLRWKLGVPGTALGMRQPRPLKGCGTERLCDLPGVPQN